MKINVCECKELINTVVCNKRFIWNPSNWECECDKSCDIGEYLDYSNCKCRKKSVDKLIEKCLIRTDEVEITETIQAENTCSSCTLYIVLFSIIFTLSSGIAAYFVYYKYMSRNKENVFKYDYFCQVKNY